MQQIKKFDEIHKHPAKLIYIRDHLSHWEEAHYDLKCVWNRKGYYFTVIIQNDNYRFANGEKEYCSKYKRELIKEVNKIKIVKQNKDE